MKNKLIVLMGCTLIAKLASAQSVLQDKSGDGTLVIGKNTVSFNAGDVSASGSIGHFHLKKGSTDFWKFTAKFKSTDGASSLFDGSKFKPTVDLGFYNGHRNANDFTWYAGGKLSSSFFNLLKGDNSNTFADREFIAPTLTFGINQVGSLSKQFPSFIFGLNLNLSVINNLTDLTSVDVFQTTAVSKNDTTLTSQQGKTSGYTGDYRTSGAILLNSDFFAYPKFLGGQIAVGGYMRLRAFGYQPRQNIGAGFLMGSKGAPTNIVFGLLYQFNDVLNQLDKQNSFLKRGGVNLVAGYTF